MTDTAVATPDPEPHSRLEYKTHSGQVSMSVNGFANEGGYFAGSWGQQATSMPIPSCSYCGGHHGGMCSRIKSIEYYPNGTIKRVELS